MKKQCHVDRVFVIFKLNEANGQVIYSEPDKVHILRNCAQRRAIILEKWSDFKLYCQDKFTDLIYRSLNTDRDENFCRAATQFVEGIIQEPFERVNNSQPEQKVEDGSVTEKINS